MPKTTIHIEGYGDIVVKHPKEPTTKNISETIATTVSETMNLVVKIAETEQFHPVLGLGNNNNG